MLEDPKMNIRTKVSAVIIWQAWKWPKLESHSPINPTVT